MVKGIVFLVSILFVFQTQAAYMASCRIWDRGSDLNLHMTTMLVESIGSPSDKIELHPSIMDIVDNESQTLLVSGNVFNDIDPSSTGFFEIVEIETFPINSPDDIKNPKPVIERVRQLSLDLKFKNTAMSKVQALSMITRPMTAIDSTFTGDGSVTYQNKVYDEATFNCNVFISWNLYRSLAEKVKKP